MGSTRRVTSSQRMMTVTLKHILSHSLRMRIPSEIGWLRTSMRIVVATIRCVILTVKWFTSNLKVAKSNTLIVLSMSWQGFLTEVSSM